MPRSTIREADLELIGRLIVTAGLVEWMWIHWCQLATKKSMGTWPSRSALRALHARRAAERQWAEARAVTDIDGPRRVRTVLSEAQRALKQYRNPIAHCAASPTADENG